ncbi:MAG: hypothetical protein M3065_03650 [Actinomycetota bacterium]|nr:hypothetical protein [Actinomycetota bacterium]
MPFVPPELRTFPLPARVRVCQELADCVTAAFEGPRLVHAGPQGNRMVLAVWGRAAGTFSAALLLAEHGYGDQVGMLARALFESAVDAYWIAAHPAEAERLGTLHFRLMRLLVAEQRNEHEQRHGDPALPLMVEDIRDREMLTRLLGIKGQRHWTTKGLPDRIKAVQPSFPQDRGDELQARYEDDNRLANLLLHGSTVALNDRITDDAFGNATIRSGPSEQHLANGLRHAYWSYQRLALIAQRRNPEARAEIERHYAEGWPLLQTITLPALKKAGRNGRCPCGSSRKVKDCHGSI